MQVKVHSKANFEMAIRTFRKKAQKEGIIREGRLRMHYEKPSIKRARREEESLIKTRRMRKTGFIGNI